ncbi:MAG TPA: DUF72 domain-containing protein [Edaphobacter sp.]|nr:DUF72 domain-containing protein [Edaphobacter sp.]
MDSEITSTRIYAGTSGWAYPTWKPEFYPAKTPVKKFLESYATQLNSVVVNYTFRALPTEKMLEGWLAATPDDFRFSFKAPQRITHFRRLRDCESDVAQLLAALGPVRNARKLGVLLFQLPPNFKADAALLNAFLSSPAMQTPDNVRIAFEFRHESWFSKEVYAALSQHEAALCIAESDDLQTPEVHTSTKFTCFRLRHTNGYSSEELASFARRFTALAQTRDVYAYFKHEDEPTGPLNAKDFLMRVQAIEGRH